jgi:hypothetical protein
VVQRKQIKSELEAQARFDALWDAMATEKTLQGIKRLQKQVYPNKLASWTYNAQTLRVSNRASLRSSIRAGSVDSGRIANTEVAAL